MSALQINLFGKLCVRRDDRLLGGFTAARVQELFGYLLLFRTRPHPRESLATVLWGDVPSAQAKKQLRQVLWQLQTALGQPDPADAASVLIIEPEWVSINAANGFWLDIAALEAAMTSVTGVPGRELDAESAGALDAVIRGCDGELLEGLTADWCLYERERLREVYLSARDKLMAYCEAQHLPEQGLAHGEEILRHDRARERTHRRMMRLQSLAGDRIAALRQFERCVAALEEELGVQPSRRTITLYQQIRAESSNGAVGGTASAVPSWPVAAPQADGLSATPPLSDALAQLRQVQAALQSLDQQIARGIAAIEAATRHHRSDSDGRRSSTTSR